MAWEASQPLKDSREAGADLSTSQYCFVELSSTGTVTVCNAATDVPYGVLQNNPTSGKMAEIVIIGITKLKADAALATIGTAIGTSADGKADAKVAGTDTTEYIVGRTLSVSAAENEIITAVVNCASPARAA